MKGEGWDDPSQRLFKRNSAYNEPKLAKFMLIQVRYTRNRWKVKKVQQLSSKCGISIRNVM